MSGYRGRFAPSPTGPLHFGSLIAAVGSYLDARHSSGQWLVRIEDIDEPRTVPGAESAILTTLDAYGFVIDEPVVRQSERQYLYTDALQRLKSNGIAYPCGCSRKEIADSQILARGSVSGLRYPGTCSKGLPAGKTARAWRVRVPGTPICFHDRVMGHQQEVLEDSIGDFVVVRADGYFAYQLAVVVDDAEQRVTHIVRGADLLDSTGRQLFLQRAIGYPEPSYLHLPVAQNAAGEKLSKQTLAPPLEAGDAGKQLVRALQFLGQDPPPDLEKEKLQTIWDWSIEGWDVAKIPRVFGIAA